MMADHAEVTERTVVAELLTFLEERTKSAVTEDQDLFATGAVSSMFAMQLVVHLEEAYDVTIVGGDLKQVNFRTVRAMAELVLRLREAQGVTGGA
ncbi:acyl carrier protein [Actinoalloteichus sp. AHMU CJ021]|uniref:Methoxymalonate biosynthesis acyl carrier protein n=1 Tax=Actinoalloteichus caeruleus DSM 43889 TaxID=1120930 RepID=A0ABT1JDL4_ACTCY|nr:acyl carrier protein [Actinoalloteichus caeruleus]AUS81171.1 acyl carrier protein [Actinoalloteichus sp. AHMU CJ021]MCP2330591.1 methoxymalonate biosynthesis acyl carrier protein [Actinoalloteichus caeruleus DSM 43889]